MSIVPIGRLFPSGGPADPDMMVGRLTEVEDLVATLDQGVHMLVAGDRRVGKTTVCRAAQAKLRDEHDMRVLFVEVPERSSSVDLCQLVVDRCLGAGPGRRLAKAATPLVQKLIERQGIPLRDLAPTIARTVWRDALPGHFERAGHPIGQAPLNELLDYGAERPYPMMTAARHAALTAHRLGGETDSFCVQDGINAAEQQMHDDGYHA